MILQLVQIKNDEYLCNCMARAIPESPGVWACTWTPASVSLYSWIIQVGLIFNTFPLSKWQTFQDLSTTWDASEWGVRQRAVNVENALQGAQNLVQRLVGSLGSEDETLQLLEDNFYL